MKIYHVLEKLKLNPQWDTTAHLLGWLKLRRLAIPSVCENREHSELSFSAQRNGKLYNHLGSSLAIS